MATITQRKVHGQTYDRDLVPRRVGGTASVRGRWRRPHISGPFCD